MKLKTINFLALGLILLVGFLATRSLLFRDGLHPTHDANIHLFRTQQLKKLVFAGQFPPRWAPDFDFGYGSPVLSFNYPLPSYLIFSLNFIGFSFSQATKLLMIASFLFSGLFIFLLLKFLFNVRSALLGAITYLLFPFHAVELYVRGAVGELITLALVPLILFLFLKLNHRYRLRYYFGILISLSLLILAHNIAALIFYPVLILFLFLLPKLKLKIKLLLSLIPLCLTAYFWFPSIFEIRFTQASQRIATEFNYLDHFVYLPQLYSSPWGYAGSAPGMIDGMSFALGRFNFLLVFAGLFIGLKFWPRFNHPQRLVFGLGLFFSFSGLFLSLNLSEFIWRLIPFMYLIQFPWRFLNFWLLGASILTASIFAFKTKFKTITLFILLILTTFLILQNLRWFRPSGESFITDDFLTPANIATTNTTYGDEQLPFAVEQKPQESPSYFIETIPPVQLDIQTQANQHNFTIDLDYPVKVIVHHFYYPGWQVLIDDQIIQNLEIEKPYGNFSFPISSGNHQVQIQFTETPLRLICNFVSLLTLTLLVLAIIKPYVYHRN